MTGQLGRLGDVIDITSGFAFESSMFSNDNGVPLVRIRDVERGFSETHYIGEYEPQYVVDDGDLLVSMDGEFRVAPWKGGKALLNQRVCRIEPLPGKSHGPYLRHVLPRELKRIEDATPYATVKHLSVKTIREILIPLPPLPEQRRIAAILDKADCIRRKREEGIRLTEELLRSTFHEMFGDPVTNPKGWRQTRLDCLATVERGKFTPRPRNDPRFYGGDYPFIQTGDISNSGGVLRNWKQTLNEEGVSVSRSFPKGTVVIAIVGATIGETAILDCEMYCPDSVIGIQALPGKSTPEFLEYLLRFHKYLFREKAPETARANINLETLAPLLVPTPPVQLQSRFSGIFWACYRVTDRMQAGLAGANDLFNSLVQRAFRGEL